MSKSKSYRLSKAEAAQLAHFVNDAIAVNDYKMVIEKLKPLLDSKCPFSKLDDLGRQVGQAGVRNKAKYFRAFDKIVDYNTMGGFVIVSQALNCFVDISFDEVMEKGRRFVIIGNAWYTKQHSKHS